MTKRPCSVKLSKVDHLERKTIFYFHLYKLTGKASISVLFCILLPHCIMFIHGMREINGFLLDFEIDFGPSAPRYDQRM